MAIGRALSSRQVDALQAHGVHFVAPSLYLQIRPQGTRSWLFRYSQGGRNRWHGLGPVEDISLTKARERAAELRQAVKYEGADPIADRRAAKATAPAAAKAVPTFDHCAKLYIASHEAGWRSDKHAEQWTATLKTYASPVIGSLPVDQVTVDHLMKILRPVWTSKSETASRLRGRIEKVLGWAAAHNYRTGANPAAWAGGPLQHLLPPINKVRVVKPREAVPYAEVPALVKQLHAMGSTSATAIIFTLLTGARTAEVIGATWSEVDLDAKVWTIPGPRMKSGREHRVALSDAAVVLLKALPRSGKYLFAGGVKGKPLSNMAMVMCLQGLRDSKETVHGFRSSFSTWAAEKTTHDRAVVEAALAHATGDAVELAYKRTDYLAKRTALMDDWARHCTGANP